MTFTRNLLSDAVRYGLAAGAVSLFSLAAAPAFAQDTTNTSAPPKDSKNAKDLDKVTVTGSRIKRSQVEGPDPITVITRKDLEVKGDLSVADVLRSSTFNSFGSAKETSGVSGGAQSQATINLRGLGSQRSLVLIDGRRMASSPAIGGNVQNLNAIPFAAVERIEILRDGASAIYGSDAIGGVINIILRKDFEGLTISAGVERPTRGEPNANSGSIVGGVTSDKGNITFVIDHEERDIFYNRDRPNDSGNGPNPAVGLSSFGFPPSALLYNSSDGSFSGAGLGYRADPRCPTALGSDPLFPNSVLVPAGSGTKCKFNYAATNANTASLRKDSVLINSNYDITDNIRAFTRITTLNSESLGVYAPTPITTFPTMAGNNPNNIFHKDLYLLFRMVPAGNRVDNVTDTMLDVLFGLEGQNNWFGGTNWSLALHHSRYQITDIGEGYILGPPIQSLIDSGVLNPFGDPSDPGVAAGIAQGKTTIIANAKERYFGGDGQINFDLFQMPSGPAGFAAGFDYKDESYSEQFDAQSDAHNVFGTAGGSARGERASYAIFAELNLPILKNLALDIAGRLDHYNDFGTSTNPKISLEYRPLDSLLLRASYGTGFRAPSLQELNSAAQQSFTAITDNLNCPHGLTPPPHDALGSDGTENTNLGDPCHIIQHEVSFTANKQLQPEKSKNWAAGVVWSPGNFNISLDAFNIKITNVIRSFDPQLAADIYACQNPFNGVAPNRGICDGIPTSLPAGVSVTLKPNGALNVITVGNVNIAAIQTAGVDIDASYKWATSVGTFTPELQITRMTKYDLQTLPGTQPIDVLSTGFTGTTEPKLRAVGTLNWSKGDFGMTLIGNMIGPAKTVGSGGLVELGTYTTWDVQATWNTPWKGKVTAGVRNIADRMAPLSSAFAFPYYLQSQYDALGRVPYLQYSQSF